MNNQNCRHKNLVLLDSKSDKLRCKHCHLTIDENELENGYCPECYEVDGIKRSEFELFKSGHELHDRYCCEGCGTLIQC